MPSRRRTVLLPRVGGGRPPRRLLAVLAVLLVATGGTAYFSGATFTSTTQTNVRVGAANDYTPPTVALSVPAVVSGTTTIPVTAADARTSVTRVVTERQLVVGGPWTTICTRTSAPWDCTWDTTTVADGTVSLRATATDAVGLSATSAVVTTRVANSAAVVLTEVPSPTRGTVPLAATVTGVAGRTVSSAFFVRVEGTTNWGNALSGCGTVAGATPTCSWATGSLTNTYDIRVRSTLGSGATAVVVEDILLGVEIDNTAPTVSLTLPSPMSGTVAVAPVVDDADSGVSRVEMSYRTSAGLFPAGQWVSLCTLEDAPYRCLLNTSTLTNLANYDVRVVVIDEAGNSAQTILTRQVSNTAASVSITAPAANAFLRGTVQVTADADGGSFATVTSVALERRAVGATAWTRICLDSTAPYACPWDTTTVPTGSYELSAVMTYGLTGATLRSSVVTVRVDNSPLRAVDVQGVNGGTRGLLDAGDTFTLTMSELADLGSIRSGWTGGSVTVSGALKDKNVTGALAPGFDRLEVPGLGEIAFAQNAVRSNRTTNDVPLTLTASTTTVDGVTATVITVRLGSFPSGNLRTATGNGTLRWTPPTSLRDASGRAASTATVLESGASDGDF